MIDLDAVLERKLREQDREPDGYLHPSSHITQSLRHTQLEMAGVQHREDAFDLIGMVRLMTGTMWHAWWEQALAGLPVMTEISLQETLPRGWKGTADWIIWDEELEAFHLRDLKTTKGDGIPWIVQQGLKEAHYWQLSSYYWALVDLGLPMADKIGAYYLPMDRGRTGTAWPVMQESYPIDRLEVEEELTIIREDVDHFLAASSDDDWDALIEPVQERVQKLRKAVNKWEVYLEPNWDAVYCPYPESFCDCWKQKKSKVGHYTADDEFVFSKGMEDIELEVGPTQAQLAQIQEKF